jgi:plastocyanin
VRLAVRGESLPVARQRQQLAARRLLAMLLCALLGAASAQAGPQVHAVSMEAVRFSPAQLEVRVGDTVEWRNADPFPHNATARDGSFRSGDVAPGQSWQFKAGRKGRFPYACTLHPGMEAVLVVK